MKCRHVVLLGLVAVAMLSVGCQEKFTKVRYETVYVGQPQFEVEALLGEPEFKFSDTWTYNHEEPFYKAVIQFREGRVSDKAWYDGQEWGDLPDNKPQ